MPLSGGPISSALWGGIGTTLLLLSVLRCRQVLIDSV
jgi:hypothetical protein